ncbi:MAG: BamA/TamA family outer membrane protein, partial [Catalinimonas sp.]
NFNSYGLTYERRNQDDLYYPRRGWHLLLEAAVGNKRLSGGEAWTDSLAVRTTQTTAEGAATRYFTLRPRLVLVARGRGGGVFGPNLFVNDLYQLGGLQTLRGFDENYFFAARYAVATAELRWFLDATSYLRLFVDQGYVSARTVRSDAADRPLGAGVGLSFRTAAGVFQFDYALGRAQDQRFAANQSKIHFGLTSRF